ncbi:hypothetical protein AVEN_112966-1 [Araneus ventricosus]|uniref:Uncharacterized protein n=1 Tax=Araneus ventricosus TaxID=182803 RepID=A0A4Y2QS28_ARAVE|nr:hypothetical protein AVEN_233738-1 [Araneus ventricosus]GBN63822.1 hypothetical protein AVEN_190368-1 [Araneus ventricosus]GBN65997.1 hypothetical protein AVEN_1486-1 [Araneus ventricosus]GBN66078.1 hypothetical protein AVEN_112966-1 [Araneus ventricosus]
MKMAMSDKMTNWVEGKMTNPSTMIQEFVVLPECHLPLMQITGTPGKNEHLIKKEIEEKEDKRKPCQLNKAEVNKTKRNKSVKILQNRRK